MTLCSQHATIGVTVSSLLNREVVVEARTFCRQAEINYLNTIDPFHFSVIICDHSRNPLLLADSPHSMASPNTPADATPRTDNATDTPIAGQKRKRDTEDDSNPWVGLTKVLVGPDEKPYLVHSHILRKVPFFRGCLDAGMIERAEGVVKLPEDNPKAFSHVVHWLYHGKLPVDLVAMIEDAMKAGNKTASSRLHDEIYTFTDMYVLCHRLMMEELQNHLTDIFREVTRQSTWPAISYQRICDELPEENPLRKLGMQQLSWEIRHGYGGWSAWTKNSSRFSLFAMLKLDYMRFVAEAVTTYPDARKPFYTGKPCDWHVHIDTPKCKD